MNFFHCSVMSSVSPSEWLLAITSARSGQMTEAEVAISQIMYDGWEQLRVKLPDATGTEARPKHAEILGLWSNRVRNRRFPPSSLSVKPEDPWGCSICGANPIDDSIQDLDPCAIKTLLFLVQLDSPRASQSVRTKVLQDLMNAVLDVGVFHYELVSSPDLGKEIPDGCVEICLWHDHLPSITICKVRLLYAHSYPHALVAGNTTPCRLLNNAHDVASMSPSPIQHIPFSVWPPGPGLRCRNPQINWVSICLLRGQTVTSHNCGPVADGNDRSRGGVGGQCVE